MNIYDWAYRWGVSVGAVNELIQMPLPVPSNQERTEAAVQQDIRLTASQHGCNLWRNNSGVLFNQDGQPVRYGLGNDSKRINEQFKSSDLIGIKPTLIRPEHVGRVIGQFIAFECKPWNWRFNPNAKRDQGQWRFLQLVNSKGGYGSFATSKEDFMRCING